MQSLQPMQNPYFRSKFKIPKNMSKSILQIIQTRSLQQIRSKKHQIFEKWDHFKNRPACRGYSPCKILTLGQKLKFQKRVKIHSTNHLQLFCAKIRSKKDQIFQKRDHFENRPSCKGYSPCKILTLGQKLKFQKTCQNPSYKSCLLYTSPSPRDQRGSRMPSSA